jgi:hypothetical protein
MAQVVKVDLRQACLTKRGQLHAAAEIAPAELSSIRADEDQTVITRLGMTVQMVTEAGDDQRRNLDRAATSGRLRRTEEQLAPVGLS